MWVMLRNPMGRTAVSVTEEKTEEEAEAERHEGEDEECERFRPYGLHTTPRPTLDGIETAARIVSVHDGDTVTAVVPAFGGYYVYHVRLDGIDACELGAARPANRAVAALARDRLLGLILDDPSPIEGGQKGAEERLDRDVRVVRLRCGRFDKYGRVLGRITTGGGVEVNRALVEEHLAYEYHGGRRLTELEQLRAMGRDPDGDLLSDTGEESSLWKRVVNWVAPEVYFFPQS